MCVARGFAVTRFAILIFALDRCVSRDIETSDKGIARGVRIKIRDCRTACRSKDELQRIAVILESLSLSLSFSLSFARERLLALHHLPPL